MTIPYLVTGSESKGIDILGTGDATQPDWLGHLKRTLVKKNDKLTYKNTTFVLTVEIEDMESIHHLVLLPSFESVENLRTSLCNSSPNIDSRWGGRPRVNLSAEEIAGFVRDVGGIIGPAHAFTPFRAIFREGKYDSITDCYQSEAPHIHFIELGLSADSKIADYIPELRKLTYITSSDAHSPSPDKLGREFIRFEMESPTFEELKLAIIREKGRRPTLNIGLHPKLGKYYLSFCSKCRRTLVVKKDDAHPTSDEVNIYISSSSEADLARLLSDIHKRQVNCPVDGKPLRLGVRDRVKMLGEVTSKTPSHRPLYLHIPPLLDMIVPAIGVKSKSTKSARTLYQKMMALFGSEIDILTNTSISDIEKVNSRVSKMIDAYRQDEVGYVPGGGGRYGTLIAPWNSE